MRDASVIRDDLWWAHEGNRAIQVGGWKLVAAGKDGPWELYDLSMDRCETKDIAGIHPEKARELAELWTKRLDEFREIAGRADDK